MEDYEKIKICIGTDAFFPLFDGPIQVASNYAKELNKISECKVVAPYSGDKNYKDEQPYEVFRCKSIPFVLGYRAPLPGIDCKFKRYMRREKFDVVHMHSPFTMARFFLKYCKRHKIPFIITLHTKFDQDLTRVTKIKLLRRIMMRAILKSFRKADHVWTVNNATVETLRSYGYKGEVSVVKNGTDMRYPENAPELRERIRKKFVLAEDELVFIFIGRIVMYKNLALICESLKIAREHGLKFKMLVVGFGPDEDKLKEKTAECGLLDNFIFAGKVTDREELSAYYAAADLFLFPSTFDTASLVPIEAAAHKLPTLLITGCSTAEGTADGINAFTADENAAAYARKITDISADRTLLKQAGENAYRDIYRPWSKVAEEVYEKYLETIKLKKNGTRRKPV